ncbi:HAD family phosphatase [Candidatus Woesearchaeota archaeon]|nr:HAD family phosphatase [Candidatus Woesearchaeota archaeon]
MIKAIILDWGGVLNLTGHASLISKQIAERYKIEYMKIIEVIVPLWKKLNRNTINLDELVKGVNSGLGTAISTSEITLFLENSFDINQELIVLLKELKKQYSLMILSNNNEPLVKAIQTAHAEIYKLFDKHYYSYQLKLRKPDAAIFEYVLDDTGLTPEECLFIDDGEENTTAASNIGMQTIVYKDNNQLKKELAALGIL